MQADRQQAQAIQDMLASPAFAESQQAHQELIKSTLVRLGRPTPSAPPPFWQLASSTCICGLIKCLQVCRMAGTPGVY